MESICLSPSLAHTLGESFLKGEAEKGISINTKALAELL